MNENENASETGTNMEGNMNNDETVQEDTTNKSDVATPSKEQTSQSTTEDHSNSQHELMTLTEDEWKHKILSLESEIQLLLTQVNSLVEKETAREAAEKEARMLKLESKYSQEAQAMIREAKAAINEALKEQGPSEPTLANSNENSKTTKGSTKQTKQSKIITRPWNKFLKIDKELVTKVNKYISIKDISIFPESWLPITRDQASLLNKALEISGMISTGSVPLINTQSLIILHRKSQESFASITQEYREAKTASPLEVGDFLKIFKKSVAAEHDRLRVLYAQQFLKGLGRNTGPMTNTREITLMNQFHLPSERSIFSELQNGTRPAHRFSAFHALWKFEDLSEAEEAASQQPQERVIPQIKHKIRSKQPTN